MTWHPARRPRSMPTPARPCSGTCTAPRYSLRTYSVPNHARLPHAHASADELTGESVPVGQDDRVAGRQHAVVVDRYYREPNGKAVVESDARHGHRTPLVERVEFRRVNRRRSEVV